jgi:radical SAM superfamily enzyme YgiQ (UPF0313 family)
MGRPRAGAEEDAVPDVRFLLVNPTSPLWRARAAGRPRGARPFRFSMLTSLYVAAAMPAGVRTRIVDEDVEPLDLDAEADLVGISCMTYNALRAYEIADELRRRGRAVVLGGYHPTFLPDEAAAHADAVCVGEAEGTVPRLMADFLAGRLQRRYVSEPVDLRGLAVPDRRLIRSSAYVTPDAVQATRGCPHACSFCSVSAFARRRFRKRPVDEVVDELRPLGRWLIFMDDNIALDRDYARELFARMAPLGKRWCSQCGVGIADDPELVSLAARSGCMGLFVGLESLSDENLAAWRKTPNRHRDYARAVARLHAAGIGVYAGFVFGMDGDRPDVFARTLDFLEDARVDALQATILTPFPGTPLFAEMEREGRITTRDWSLYDFGHVVFEPRGLSPEALRAGHAWIQGRFYSRASTWRRIARAFGHLSPAVVVHAMAPLNLGYRARHRAYGTFEAARLATEAGEAGGGLRPARPAAAGCRRAPPPAA